MRGLAPFGVLLCLVSVLTGQAAAARERMPGPSDGAVADGVYVSRYFDVALPLPMGWTEGLAGPEPSHTGYHVLGTFVPAGEPVGTILIAAQDLFFSGEGSRDATAMAVELSIAMAGVEGMTIDRPPSAEAIAGRSFSRVDFSGAGLFRSAFITDARCHRVTFKLLANAPERLADLTHSLHKLAAVRHREEGRDPACVKGYADAENVLSRVDPPAIAPVGVPIPVRIVIGADGGVKHVNVIRATPAQRTGIEHALMQWTFKPHQIDGRAAEVETGLLIQFTAAGTVVYSAGDQAEALAAR